MIATLSWAPLKNSGLRSSGMSSVALLFISDPAWPEPRDSRFRGCRVAGCCRAASRPPADMTKTCKYSRFRANKKRPAFSSVADLDRRLPPEPGERKMEKLDANCWAIRPACSACHDIHHPSARTLRWCAGRSPGHRRRRRSRAGDGLFAAYGSAPGPRHFTFHSVAAHRTRSFARILEAGPSGLACRDSVRSWNAIRRLCGELDRATHAIPELERIVRLLPNIVWISALEKGAA